MKLPDFSEDKKLTELLQLMDAELTPWQSGVDGILVTTGIEISLKKIEYAPDGTLEYEGRKVVVYIRDQHVFDSYELVDPDELVDPEELRKFHVASCSTLKLMRSKNRYDKYVVATRTDGKFIINFLVNNKIHEKGERVERRLYVCKHCLNALDYQNYRNKKTQQNEIREFFDLNEFFEMYGSQITSTPPETDITAPENKYSPDWPQIRERYKEKVEWRCEKCSIDLRKEKKFLDVHHINGLRNNNGEENLCALCIGCHAEQFQHQHIKATPKYKKFLRWRDQQQSNREDFIGDFTIN